MDANNVQNRMQEIQKDQSFSNALGKILSGKSNYKPVIEMRKIEFRCKHCGTTLEETMKFCHQCGTKAER